MDAQKANNEKRTPPAKKRKSKKEPSPTVAPEEAESSQPVSEEYVFVHPIAVNTFVCLYPELLAKGDPLEKVEPASVPVPAPAQKKKEDAKPEMKSEVKSGEGLLADEFEITKLDA